MNPQKKTLRSIATGPCFQTTLEKLTEVTPKFVWYTQKTVLTMILHHLGALVLLSWIQLVITWPAVSSPLRARSIYDIENTCHSCEGHQYLTPSATMSTMSSPITPISSDPAELLLTKRMPMIGTQYLSGGWFLRYEVLRFFRPTSLNLMTLSSLWSGLAATAALTAGDEFNEPIIRYDLGDLRVEMFSMDGPITRQILIWVSDAMLTYTGRGFCGLFNARLSGPEHSVWITFYKRG